jgi:pimeloyl-ACP methyl ester carboxylesterase
MYGSQGLTPPDELRTLARHPGVAIAYRLYRPGPPRRVLVLLHGVASNMTRWTEFVRETRLRESWDLLRLDLRGHGQSLSRGRVGLPEWADDLAAVLAAEACPPAVVAGHCLGAGVALEFALRHPARTAGLVLVEPMLRPALTGRLRRLVRLRPLVAAVASIVLGLNALGLHRRRLRALDLEALDRRTRAAMAAGGTERLLAAYASPVADLRTTPTVTYLQDLLAVTAPLPALGQVAAPTLALLSTGGLFGDPASTEALLAALPRARVVTLQGRHWLPTEQPVAMRQAIEGWCWEQARQPAVSGAGQRA